jgi:hypothetical protein
VFVTANDLDCARKTLAMQILTNQAVEILSIAVRDEETSEHLQCRQNLLLAVQNAKMHPEAMVCLIRCR